MKVNVEVRIELKNKKEIVLSGEDAERLYDELHKIYGRERISYPWYVPIPYDPYPWKPWTISNTSDGLDWATIQIVNRTHT